MNRRGITRGGTIGARPWSKERSLVGKNPIETVNYHIARDGQQIGVFPEEEVPAKIQEGSIKPNDLVWAAGMPDWKPAGEVFSPTFAEASAPAPGTEEAAPSPATAQPVQAAVTGMNLPPKPENYLVWAVLVTVLCCLPLGIVSIVFAAQVDSKYQAGDYQGALDSSRKAKNFAWWSFGVGLLVVFVAVAAQIIAALTAASGGY